MDLGSLLIFIVILGVDSRFIFDHVEKTENRNYVNSTYNIDNSGDISYLNWNITLKRRLQLKIMIKTDVYLMPNKRLSIFPIPRLNYCDMGLHSARVPLLSDVFGLITRYAGSGLTRCPTELGFYQLTDIHIDNTTLSGLHALRLKANYMLQFQLVDENGKKPTLIYKYKIYVRYE